MKQKFVSKIPLLCPVLFGLIFFFSSCRDKEEEVTYWKESVVGTADISGRVTDNFGTPLGAVTVDYEQVAFSDLCIVFVFESLSDTHI